MTSSTIRQKYIHNIPYDDDEFPLVIQDDFEFSENDSATISGVSLYSLEESDFVDLVHEIREQNINKIIIQNDYNLKSSNQILKDGIKCYLLAFVYLFKKHGFRCKINNQI